MLGSINVFGHQFQHEETHNIQSFHAEPTKGIIHLIASVFGFRKRSTERNQSINISDSQSLTFKQLLYV